MDNAASTTTALMPTTTKHYYRPAQAVIAVAEQQQHPQQQPHHYYHFNTSGSSNNNSNHSGGNGGGGKNGTITTTTHYANNHHHNNSSTVLGGKSHHHHHYASSWHHQQQATPAAAVAHSQKRQHQQHNKHGVVQHNHVQQQQHFHQSVNNGQHHQQQQQQNGCGSDGGGQQQKRGMVAGGGEGGFALSSSSSPSASTMGAASALIVVDPPRPPFIPKKPVLNGHAGGVVVDEHPHSHHHPPPRYHDNRIYAQASNGRGSGCENGCSSSGAMNGDNDGTICSAPNGDIGGTKMVIQTTTTYIGGATPAGLRRTIATKSPEPSLQQAAAAVATIEMRCGSGEDGTTGAAEANIEKQYNCNNGTEQYNNNNSDHGDPDDQHQQQQNRNVKAATDQSGGDEKQHNNSTATTNGRNTESSSSLSAGSTTTAAAAADQRGASLHYSVTGGVGMGSNNNNNGVEKMGGGGGGTTANSGNNRPQRRLSLAGGVSAKLPPDYYQRLPISSFGCSTDGHGREGRIYATAGLSAAGTGAIANENLRKYSALSNTTTTTAVTGGGGGGTLDRRGGNSSIFALKNSAAIAGGSQMCLNAGGASLAADGKSTLSRRAHKLAQKAAHKFAIGTLSSELSSSASALYSLFTSSPAENGGSACGVVLPAAAAATTNGTGGNADEQQYGAIYAEAFVGSHDYYHDKAPIVSAHTSRGIDFLERFGHFAKERALIEEEYAAKLKSLAKRSRSKKNDDDEAKQYTTTVAFQTMLAEMEALASQHEVIGERLRSELYPQLAEKCRLLRALRKKLYQDFEQMEKNLAARVDELAKQKKNYEKAHLDAQGAHVKCAKAEKNMYITRMDLEKARANVHTKNSICEQSKQNYAAQLGATNQAKFDHYNVCMPQLLEEMRRLDIERIEFTRQSMLNCVTAETGVLNIIQRCYSDMNNAIGTINPAKDTVAVVEQTKSGFAHPLDYQFEDLGDPADILQDGAESFDGSTIRRQSGQGKGSNGKGGGVPRKQSLKLFSNSSNNGKNNGSSGSHGSAGGGAGTNCAGGGGSSAIAGSEYGTLPPQQRCRKIQQKLEELDAELNIKDQSQAGMQRMHVAYSQNPQLGDPTKVAEQLAHNQQDMHTLQAQIQRFKELLRIAQGELNQPLGGCPQSQHHNHCAPTTASSSPGSSPRGSAGSGGAGKLKNGHHHHQQQHGGGGRFNGGAPGGHQQLGGAASAEHRASSYSEASSISSADGSVLMLSSGAVSLNGGAGGGVHQHHHLHFVGPPASQQQHPMMNGGISNNGNGGAGGHLLHHSASGSSSGAMLLMNAAAVAQPPAAAGATTVPPSPPQQQPPVAAVAPQPPPLMDNNHHHNSTTTTEFFYEECDTPAAAGTVHGGHQPAQQQQSDIVLGTAIALYPYDVTPDESGGTTISMREGDELLLLERDVGDGWTRVRHMQTNAEGFVPSSYLDCKWYSPTDGGQ